MRTLILQEFNDLWVMNHIVCSFTLAILNIFLILIDVIQSINFTENIWRGIFHIFHLSFTVQCYWVRFHSLSTTCESAEFSIIFKLGPVGELKLKKRSSTQYKETEETVVETLSVHVEKKNQIVSSILAIS